MAPIVAFYVRSSSAEDERLLRLGPASLRTGAVSLGPALDRTQPHPPDEPAPGADEGPIPGKPAARRCVCRVHARLGGDEPGVTPCVLDAEVHHRLRDAGSLELLELRRRS